MFKNPILNIKIRPYAFARIKGGNDYPHINGIAYFYKVQKGVLVSIQLNGLPASDEICKKIYLRFIYTVAEDAQAMILTHLQIP